MIQRTRSVTLKHAKICHIQNRKNRRLYNRNETRLVNMLPIQNTLKNIYIDHNTRQHQAATTLFNQRLLPAKDSLGVCTSMACKKKIKNKKFGILYRKPPCLVPCASWGRLQVDHNPVLEKPHVDPVQSYNPNFNPNYRAVRVNGKGVWWRIRFDCSALVQQ